MTGKPHITVWKAIGTYHSSNFKGGYSKGPWDYILQFNPDNGTWSNIGKMKQARSFHGASLVNVDDVIDYCN